MIALGVKAALIALLACPAPIKSVAVAQVVGRPQVDLAPPNRAPFGSMGLRRHGAVTTDVPKAGIKSLTGTGGLAIMEDGDLIRWRLPWDGQPEGFEQVSEAQAASMSIPIKPPPHEPLSSEVPGETGCQLISGRRTSLGRLGAWNCESAGGTLLGVVGGTSPPHILARLPARYQALATVPDVPDGPGGLTIILAAYDPSTRRFEYAVVGWFRRYS